MDVFTDRRFGGNPLAVVLDALELSGAQMQSIAAEFNYAETTFVLPPRDPKHTAQVRIFTPRSEVPFAGHPNVGTAFVLARNLAAAGQPLPERFEFEEGAGLVPVRLLPRRPGSHRRGTAAAPERSRAGPRSAAAEPAACLSLPAAGDHAAPRTHRSVVSVGLPFLVAELSTRAALARSRPDLAAHEKFLPGIGSMRSLRTCAMRTMARHRVLHARMYAPLDGIEEDPATGSATAATLALLTTLEAAADFELPLASAPGR